MKIFISQPMSNLSIEQVKSDRERAKLDLCNMVFPGEDEFDDDNFLDNLQEDKDPNTTHPLNYLGDDIKMLEHADLVYFVKGWEKSRGCHIEFQVAREYKIPMMFEE